MSVDMPTSQMSIRRKLNGLRMEWLCVADVEYQWNLFFAVDWNECWKICKNHNEVRHFEFLSTRDTLRNIHAWTLSTSNQNSIFYGKIESKHLDIHVQKKTKKKEIVSILLFIYCIQFDYRKMKNEFNLSAVLYLWRLKNLLWNRQIGSMPGKQAVSSALSPQNRLKFKLIGFPFAENVEIAEWYWNVFLIISNGMEIMEIFSSQNGRLWQLECEQENVYSACVMLATKHPVSHSFSHSGNVEMVSTESEVMRLTSGSMLTVITNLKVFRRIGGFFFLLHFFLNQLSRNLNVLKAATNSSMAKAILSLDFSENG